MSGYIERVAYEEGREVHKGDLLFVIDQRRYRAALDRAVAEFERARSEARLAASELERAETLLASKAISREEFDTRRAANVRATRPCGPPRRRSTPPGSTCSSPRSARRSTAAPGARW